MIQNNEIRKCLQSVIEIIMSENESLISKICDENYFPSQFVLQEINDYPGRLSKPEIIIFDESNINRMNDDDLFLFFNLWFDNKQSDLIVTIRIIKQNKKLKYFIDEVHVH